LWKEPLQVLNRAEVERLIGYVATFADPEVSDKYQNQTGPGAQLANYNILRNNFQIPIHQEELDDGFSEYKFKLRKRLFLMQMEECFAVRMEGECFSAECHKDYD